MRNATAMTQRMLSRPIGVMWAGWKSDTLHLQQAGWDLAVEYAIHRDEYRLLAHHQQGHLYGMSNATHLDKMLADPMYGAESQGCFYMTGLSRSLEIITHNQGDLSAFQQIDARPVMVERVIQRIEDFNIFNVTGQGEAILVEEADMSVIDHLQAIKDLQSDGQREIRDRLLQARERGDTQVAPEVKVHANIISFRRPA